VTLSHAQQQQIRDLIMRGVPDEEIAQAMMISVKLVRPLRLALEAHVRPR
jgi:hypothetical protein